MRTMTGAPGPEVETPEGIKLVFCSNDYLGLAADPRLVEALVGGARRWGVGAAASRLVSGDALAHEELESRLAELARSPRAVLFPSGYQANVGALSCLSGEGDVVFSDELNHASLIDGCRLSRAAVRVFPHRDVERLDALLRRSPASGLRLIASDALFSMDGDLAPLEEICDVAARHDALVYLDEAHSLGVLGPGGRGLACELGLEQRVAVRVGTLGKALGVCGAFVACDESAARLIRSSARSLLYTTGPPPALAEAVLAALGIAEAADARREALFENVELFRRLASAAGIELGDSRSPIQPVPVGGSRRAMEISERLWKEGVFVQGIRPPTVPEGTARLRVTLTAAHEPGHVERLVEALRGALEETVDER